MYKFLVILYYRQSSPANRISAMAKENSSALSFGKFLSSKSVFFVENRPQTSPFYFDMS